MFYVSKRLRTVAKKVIDNALPIKRGEIAVFCAGVENLDLAYAFAAECEARGIETLVQSEGDYISNTKLLEAPTDAFERTPKIPEAIVDVADWLILMRGSRFDTSIYQKSETQKRLLEIQKISKWTFDSILQLCLKKKTHLVAFLDPNLQQAQALGKTYEETREMFLASLDIDYDALTDLGQRLINFMKRGGEIHLTCPRGTDLKFHAENRYWINDDGKSSPPSIPIVQYVHNLPVGEVFVAPIEESAYGVLCPKDLPGSVATDIRIEFRGKKKAAVSAEKGFEFLKARLEKATGNPYCMAEFAFGTNPCGDMLLATEKAYGTCHVAIGQNTWLGGKNESSIHWDFLVECPTVTVDGRLVVKEGKFVRELFRR
ncbi:MAG: aminopeptidase [Candidatus Bathyarchaeota archaeon]|jgi:leucyl aminopeptidase (aminopeptidase T)|nr:aminopeptidase [Candidatus Bathyarchaeota archaeon A05DMB-5]MDH7557579.1 aminopeptidase [Candidatus Bathyarchaeota archaeon]